MELILSQESRRINLLAIYSLLPYFSGDLLQKMFGEVGRLTFTILDSHMHLKLIMNETRYCSPSKISHYNILSTKVKINMMEKVSQRMEQLKREDSLLDIDIIDFFCPLFFDVRIIEGRPSMKGPSRFPSGRNVVEKPSGNI